MVVFKDKGISLTWICAFFSYDMYFFLIDEVEFSALGCFSCGGTDSLVVNLKYCRWGSMNGILMRKTLYPAGEIPAVSASNTALCLSGDLSQKPHR